MKTNIKAFALALCVAGSFASCDVLDVEPVGSFDQGSVFSDPALAEVYLNAQYLGGRTGWGTSALRFACDESLNNFNWNNVYVVNRGEMTPDDLGGIDTWAQYYERIKECNLFLEQVGNIQGDNKAWVDRMVGEMTFLRAFYYIDLVSRYGGVPIITKTFNLDDDMMSVTRSSFEDCVKFIVTELETAADLLPYQHDDKNFGRVTKGAALAYKARILLYAASPMWNTANDQAKWKAASDAAKVVIDLKDENGTQVYALDNSYKNLFFNPQSREIIYERLSNMEFGHYHNGNNLPNGWGGYTATCVSQNMVDAYEMADGSMPTDDLYDGYYDNKADTILPGKYPIGRDPWEGRDPRFYISVVCDGHWINNGQGSMGGSVDFFINSDRKTGGSDSKYGNEGWNATKTGYSIRKFIKETAAYAWEKCDNPWIYCRLGEVYLNYAEAMCAQGNDDEARKYVNFIRERARGGKADILADVTESGTELMNRIRHERRIELAFEEHRFFDVRRWKIAETTEKQLLRGMYVSRTWQFDKSGKPDPANGRKTYLIIKESQVRDFKPQHYLLPIPQTERLKNPAIEQNPDYSN